MNGAVLPEDTTEEESKEVSRKVRDLISYLAKYDDPLYEEKLGRIRNPESVIIMVQSTQEFERGSAINMDIMAIGSFSPVAVAIAVRDWLRKSEERARLGKERI